MNNSDMIKYLSKYLTKSDIYAAKATAQISMFILKYRKELKMTQKNFAKMMGVTQAMVSKWESAEYNFSLNTISEIAEKLNVTFNIEFTPESEYLSNLSNNDYEKTLQNQTWNNGKRIIEFCTAA